MPVPVETYKPELITILTHMNASNYLKTSIVLRCPDYEGNIVKLTVFVGEKSDKKIHIITIEDVRLNYYSISFNHLIGTVIIESKFRLSQEHDFDFYISFRDGKGNRKDTFACFPSDLVARMELD